MKMQKETLVLIPGLLCDGIVWAEQCSTLSSQATCVVADTGNCASIDSMADHVLSRVDSEQLSVAGHSMGGRIALEMVRRAPERISRLALLDTGYQPVAPGDAGEREYADRLGLLALARKEGMRAMGLKWARGMVHEDRVDTPLFGHILDMIERSTPDRFEAQIGALLTRPDAEPLLEHIVCPTLLICGREDRWSPLSRHEEMQIRIRGAQLRIIESSGHMSTMEQPSAVSAALADWLTWPTNRTAGVSQI